MKKLALFLAIIMILSVVPTLSFAAEEYKLRDVNDGGYAEVSMDVYQTYETEHFQIFWDTDGANSANVTDAFLKKCETVLENCWDLFIGKMGMEPTSTSVNRNGDKTTQYKTNVVLMGTGVTHYDLGANDWGAYGSVDSEGYPYFMCCLAAMDSPTVVAHEFGHAVHYAQGDNAWKDNIFLGPWYEAVANWFAEQYIYEYLPGATQLSHLYLRESSLTKMNGRGYYEAWPILQYLTEDPDNTGVYGKTFVRTLLGTNLGNTNVLFWEVLDKANGGLSVKDTIGMYASHIATMDFENKSLYNKSINNFYNGHYFYWQQRFTVPEKLGHEENTYAVPTERAPQGMGYNIIPLEATSEEVKVTLNPMTDIEGADWRARLVKESGNVTIYSELFKANETMSMAVGDGDKLYISVAATPDISTMSKHTITGWAEHSKESKFPYENKKQYPYSVTIEGATPKWERSFSGLKQHPNGGGWVSTSANVAATAYVGENALVLDRATVSGNAIIDGYAIVAGNARVMDNAYVGDTAVLFDRAVVSGNARVIESACLYVDYKASGDAVIKGQSLGFYNGTATGEAITYGDFFEDEGHDVSNGRFSGWHSITTDASYATKNGDYYERDYIPALRTRYDFNGNLKDTYGYTDLYGVNEPEVDSDAVTFDADSYLVLDDSVLYYDDAKITLLAKGEGDVLNIGDEIVLTLGENVTLAIGEDSVEVSGNDDWNEIEVVFKDGIATLSVNGTKKTMVASVTPLEATRSGVNTIGYNFTGSVDYLRIFILGNESDNSGEIDERLYLVADTDSGKGIFVSDNKNVTVDNGLHINGNTTTDITIDGCKANKFIIEFAPSGGRTYPDHGVLDMTGDVLFAHRYATDAKMIYVGRGETNASIRGNNSIADTTNQQRLTNFVAEKLSNTSARKDRGAVNYTDGDKVRIIAENTTWSENTQERFLGSENYTGNFESIAYGEDVYTVTYYLIKDGFVQKISDSVYKGHFEGFGGFKVAGGTDNVAVSYNSLKVYTDNAEAKIVCENKRIFSEGFDGEAIAIFARYDGERLKKVHTTPVSGDFDIEIPEGFEKSKFMLWESMENASPIVAPFTVDAEWVYTASKKQTEDAFYEIEEADGKVVYTFELLDKGGADSGIMIGNGDYLNVSSKNYFSSGSIVLLFAKGELYTRDASQKKMCATYNVGERTKIKIEADVNSGKYDLYVDGQIKATGVNFRQDADLLNTLAIVENGGGVVFEIYNFRVTHQN